MKIFFSVGEPSGDIHGANLIRELRRQYRGADLELVGYGGPEMAGAGCVLHEDLTQLAVMWLTRVLANLHVFWSLLRRADWYFRERRPDAVVLIDYPGFNWWIAGRAKAHGIPVFYYGTPQLWGWASWRVRKMRRLVDHALCKLPFEEAWYGERGCRATYIGHPYFDEVRRYELDTTFLDEHAGEGPLVTILPGSRTQEVERNLPWLLKAAELVGRQVPKARFAVAAYKNRHAVRARELLAASPLAGSPQVDIFVQRTPELIHLADCCIAVSGSVSLELLYHTKPTVILYHIGRFAYAVQNVLRRVKYITLVNLLSAKDIYRRRSDRQTAAPDPDEVLFPEYLTYEDCSAEMAAHIVGWLRDEASRRWCGERLVQLREQVGAGGASQRGAAYILNELGAVSGREGREESVKQRPRAA